MSGPHVRPDAGFTLAETLVAVFVLAILSAAGGSMLITTIEGRRQLDIQSEDMLTFDIATAFISGDISSASRRTASPPNGIDPPHSLEGGPPDSDGVFLRLIRGGWDNPGGLEPRSGLTRVLYRLDGGRLLRETTRRPDATRSTPVETRVLFEGVDDIDVGFFLAGERSDVWATFAEQGQAVLPDAVELTIRFRSGAELRHLILTGGRL